MSTQARTERVDSQHIAIVEDADGISDSSSCDSPQGDWFNKAQAITKKGAIDPNVHEYPVVGYRPLRPNEIRLVDFGAQPGEPVLMHARLGDTGRYRALSYCWGTENCLHRFGLNGQALIVTSSLLVIFKEFVHRGYRGKLWADAICINQSDDAEKNVQIPLMHSIYSGAHTVIAWLGPNANPSPSTAKRLASLSTLIGLELLKNEEEARGRCIEDLLNPSMQFRDPEFQDLVLTLLCSRWFFRLWTLPEALVAQRLDFWSHDLGLTYDQMCSITVALGILEEETQHWKHFWSTCSRACSLLPTAHSLSDSHWLSRERPHYSIPRLLAAARWRDVCFERDKIHAIHALLDAQTRRKIKVDVSVQAHVVFTRAAKAMIASKGGDLSLLIPAESYARLPELPSWVPDLTDQSFPKPFGSNFRAAVSGNLMPSIYLSPDDADHTLKIQGHVLDRVAQSSRWPFPARKRWRAISDCPHMAEVRAWISACLVSTQEHFPDSAWLVLARTLTANNPEDATNGRGVNVRDISALQRLVNPAATQDFESNHYFDSLENLLDRRSFFTTDGGWVGIGPRDVGRGDVVLLLNGASVPYAARRRAGNGDGDGAAAMYEFLGACYVDGIMDGEAMRDHLEAGRPDEVFEFDGGPSSPGRRRDAGGPGEPEHRQ